MDRSVVVHLEADVTQFVDVMSRMKFIVLDVESHRRYRNRIRYERIVAQAHLGVLLDELCREFGFEPIHRRSPSFLAARKRLDDEIAADNTNQIGA